LVLLPRSEFAISANDLSARAAAGLHEHWKSQCRYISGGEVAEHLGLLATLTNLPDQTLNVAFAPGPVDRPEEALGWFEALFAARGYLPGIELRVGEHPALEHLLERRGYRVVVRRPAMVLRPPVVPDVDVPGLDMRQVTEAGDLAAFQAVQAEVFELDADVAVEFLPPRALEAGGVTFLLARHDGVPCATSAASVSEHGAGIVGVATLPAFRRRGIGRAVTAAAVRAGAAQGADLAWLYPTPMARSLYESLGFVALDDVRIWVRPSPGP
jgi:GNAT superfamily N-acetyltransferase